jgi:hypothetical protein
LLKIHISRSMFVWLLSPSKNLCGATDVFCVSSATSSAPASKQLVLDPCYTYDRNGVSRHHIYMRSVLSKTCIDSCHVMRCCVMRGRVIPACSKWMFTRLMSAKLCSCVFFCLNKCTLRTRMSSICLGGYALSRSPSYIYIHF